MHFHPVLYFSFFLHREKSFPRLFNSSLVSAYIISHEIQFTYAYFKLFLLIGHNQTIGYITENLLYCEKCNSKYCTKIGIAMHEYDKHDLPVEKFREILYAEIYEPKSKSPKLEISSNVVPYNKCDRYY